MLVWSRRLVPLVVAAICVFAATGAAARTHAGPLTGTWSGYINGQINSGVKRHRIVIVVNANETGGSWEISGACHGPLTLESISYGYHHYLQKLARGSTCGARDIDCLKPAGANVYDAVSPRLNAAYVASGTLRRIRSR